MPTFIHSKHSVFKLDVPGGGSPGGTLTLTDLSTYLDTVSFSRDLELVETTTFGSTSKQWMPGYGDGKISCSGNWDRTLATILGDLEEGFQAGTITSATYEYGPEGATAGDYKYTGECILVNFNKNSAVKDQVKIEFELQQTGAQTQTVYP